MISSLTLGRTLIDSCAREDGRDGVLSRRLVFEARTEP